MTRESQLIEVLVEAADTLVDDFDVIDFLRTLAERCVQVLEVDAAGLMLADEHGRLRTTALSSDNASLSALFKLQSDAGPCPDAYRTGVPVVNADLRAEPVRWPEFGEAARRAGFVCVHALPLRLRATAIGALTLLSADPEPLGEASLQAAQGLADMATLGILTQRESHQAELLADLLQQTLTSQVTIEQAKGVLAERCRISIDAAFALLRAYARTHDLLLSELAEDVTRRYAAVEEILVGPAQDVAVRR